MSLPSLLRWCPPAPASPPSLVRTHFFPPQGCSRKPSHLMQQMHSVIMCKAKGSEGEGNEETLQTLAIAGGAVANPVIGVSLYALKTTGCGLPPGPGGALGALEGVSYLVVAGIIGWSIYTKVKTGSGLPSGPNGLLGAVEGLSYLTVLAIVVVFGLQFLDKGFVPGPLPGEQCFG